MGFFSKTVPPPEHESCSRRLDAVEDRLRKVELQTAETMIEVLDKAEKVAERLKDRVRKRDEVVAPPTPRPRPWELHRRREG